MLNFSAAEVYEMDWLEFQAYRSWMKRWLPVILGGDSPDDAGSSDVASLPGGEIVKAY